jgi:hypothetical protein
VTQQLELDDIQAGCLRGRPHPYVGAFLAIGGHPPITRVNNGVGSLRASKPVV